MRGYKKRLHAAIWAIIVSVISLFIATYLPGQNMKVEKAPLSVPAAQNSTAQKLETLIVKGRAAKTGYSRSQFGSGWVREGGCDMRNTILARDMVDVTRNEKCQVVSGRLVDSYTGTGVTFMKGSQTSQDVQIDHIVSLSNAWQTGAQQLSKERRIQLANDPINLIAVEGNINQAKGESDAASWLPPNKLFRCEYISRQVEVKYAYGLWVTPSEKDAMVRVLSAC